MKLKKFFKSIIIGIVTGFVNGFFGSGGGTVAVPAMVMLLGLDEHRAHATAISVILPLTIISVLFYINRDYMNWDITLKVILGGVIGGYLGAKLMNICPENVLRRLFAVFMIVAAARMIWGN
ncbi:MAG: sulfite exporter TauE/SafE family protein [Clostridiaceae bacterium]|nr:sulfite exporter TauE/SafE family protein [Clostridiaceae bacterium]